jgi:hypothetical protein
MHGVDEKILSINSKKNCLKKKKEATHKEKIRTGTQIDMKMNYVTITSRVILFS